VVCSVHEWCALVQDAFEKSSGTKVSITERGSAEAFDLIRSEKAAPRHDVWFGGTGDFHLQAADLRLTLPYRSPNNALLHEWAVTPAEQSGYRTVGIYSGPLGLILNSSMLAQLRVPEPKCWSDLIKPVYRGLILMSNPQYSGTAYTLIATLVQLMGEERAFEYIKQLDANVTRYAHSGAQVLGAVAQGKTAVAIAFVHGVAEDEGKLPFALKTVTPCEGTGYEIGSMSIIKGGPNQGAAKRFFDWALTTEAQDLAAQTRQFKLSSNRGGRFDARIADPRSTRLINYDFVKYGQTAERDRLVKKWLQQIRDPSKL
jgi:iron(III) transport system substrate-binding protein